MKYGNRNFPEPSGPLQACNGTALSYPTKDHQNYESYDQNFPNKTTIQITIKIY